MISLNLTSNEHVTFYKTSLIKSYFKNIIGSSYFYYYSLLSTSFDTSVFPFYLNQNVSEFILIVYEFSTWNYYIHLLYYWILLDVLEVTHFKIYAWLNTFSIFMVLASSFLFLASLPNFKRSWFISILPFYRKRRNSEL